MMLADTADTATSALTGSSASATMIHLQQLIYNVVRFSNFGFGFGFAFSGAKKNAVSVSVFGQILRNTHFQTKVVPNAFTVERI